MMERQENSSVKIPVQLLDFGMFVSHLDRPWLQSPFLLQGFFIKNEEELHKLRALCEFVWVETSTIPATIRTRLTTSHSPAAQTPDTEAEQRVYGVEDKNLNRYPIQTSFEDELPRAQSSVTQYQKVISETFNLLSKGQNVDLQKIRQAVSPLVDSILSNPDAVVWLGKMKFLGGYTFEHALRVCIWSAALGRQLGLPKEELKDLSIAALLSDVGKLWVDGEILNKTTPLTPPEKELTQKHVDMGLEALENSCKGHLPLSIRLGVKYHHERHCGQGYPENKSGADIPLFARIIGIADFYDAVTSRRAYASPVSSGEALRSLYSSRDEDFQAALVEEFIKAIGVYPAGSVVQLTDGTIAVVVAAGRAHRLHPRVIPVFNSKGEKIRKHVIIDLSKQMAKEGTENPMEIIKSIPSDDIELDLEDFYI